MWGRCLADGGGVVGVVFAAFTGQAVRAGEMTRNQASVEPKAAKLAGPVMDAAAGFHGHQAAYRQLGAPDSELVGRQSFRGDDMSACIHGVDLDHALCQIDANSGNLVHGASPFKGLQIDDSHHQSWRHGALARRWEVPSYSFEPTLCAAGPRSAPANAALRSQSSHSAAQL